MIDKIKSTLQFLKTDLWRVSVDELAKPKAIVIKMLRIISLAVRGYKEDKIQQKASALTFYSLLSIVPVVAMAFGLAKGFGLDSKLEEQLYEQFTGQEEVLNWIIKFSNSFLENTKGGLIAGIGVVVLIWSVMKVLGNIENSFNDIWQIKKSRVFVRKLSDYITIMLLSVILMISSSGVTVFISTQIENIASEIDVVGFFDPVAFFLIKLIPYFLICLLFSLIYIVMPNTKVKISSAIAAGIIGGMVFQLVQWGYIYFQIGVSRYGAIYGSFAAFPLFLIWLQTSWLIVLFGAEISFSSQNINRYEFESDTINISYSYKRLLTLLIANLVIKNFKKGNKGYTSSEISKKLQIPIRLARQLIYELVESNIFVETISANHKEQAYHPATDINKMTISFIIEAVEQKGSSNIKVKQTNELNDLNGILNDFKDKLHSLDSNKLIMDI